MNPTRTAKLPWRKIDGRAVVVQPAMAAVHELNPVATHLWEQADGSRTFEEIVAALLDEFDSTPGEARADAQAFFQDLEKKGLIRWESSQI